MVVVATFLSPKGDLTLVINHLFDFPIVVSEHIVERKWIFPEDRFVIYEPKDEKWCRWLGIGHEEVKPLQGFLQLAGDRTLYCHPEFYKAFVAEMERVQEKQMKRIDDEFTKAVMSGCDWSNLNTYKPIAGTFTKDVIEQVKKLLPEVESRRPFFDPFSMPLEPIEFDWMSPDKAFKMDHFVSKEIFKSVAVPSHVFASTVF